MSSLPVQPNILFIMPDQWRGDCLSLENHPVLLTPVVDEIGGQGVHFHRAYSTCPSCIPARRALLTGQHPPRNGMVGFQDGHPIRVPTLPQCLGKAGYQTHLVGRCMHQYPASCRYGYDSMNLGSTNVLDDHYADYLEREEPEGGGYRGSGSSNNGWNARPWHLEEKHHPTNWIVRESRRFLKKRDLTCPVFLTTSFFAPHPPLIPPAAYYDRYFHSDLPPASIGPEDAPPPEGGKGLGVESARVQLDGLARRVALAGYFGSINHIDDQLYWLIHEFKKESVEQGRPWLIVFSTDHGEMLGDHYLFRKTEAFEGSARIPLLIQGSPELGFKPRQFVEGPVCLEDLMPTLLELGGGTVPENIDGRSLVPVLRGETDRVREVLFGGHVHRAADPNLDRSNHYVVDGRYKYIWYSSTGNEQLFDLKTDPGETCNLLHSEEHASLLQTMRSRLIDSLQDRPEGFVQDGQLIPGRPGRLFIGEE